jgi:hypothetical protein
MGLGPRLVCRTIYPATDWRAGLHTNLLWCAGAHTNLLWCAGAHTNLLLVCSLACAYHSPGASPQFLLGGLGVTWFILFFMTLGVGGLKQSTNLGVVDGTTTLLNK